MLTFDETHDVVVVGSGAGGMAAALTARHFGCSVVLLEKTRYIGGSTAISGGAVWIPENPHLASVGLTDSRGAAVAYLRAILGNRYRAETMEAFLDAGPDMVSFFEKNTALTFTPRAASPDYQDRPGAAAGGRTIDPAPFNGRLLGEDFDLLRPPLDSFLVFGGMMVNRKDIDNLLGAPSSAKRFWESVRLLARYGRDRLTHKRGTRLLMGNAMAARLLRSARDAAIDLRTSTAVSTLIIDAGRVVGVVAESAGQTPRIGPRLGVVLATGGFPGNAAMQRQSMAHAAHLSVAPADNTGDGIRMALTAGAALGEDNIGNAFWTPVSVLKTATGREVRFPHLILDRQKPGLVAVDQQGRRFVNEAISYHEFVEAMLARGSAAQPAWLVCDAAFIRRYGLGLARPGPRSLSPLIRAGYLISAPTVAALAERLNMPAAALVSTVERMNDCARTGHDPEFGKGSTAYNRYLGDADHRPNPCLGPIATPPFYAVAVWPGDIGTAKGVLTNRHAQVIDRESQPIPGLYAAGNDMNSVMAGAYPGAGITLGPALTFGYLAGRHIAAARGAGG